MTIKNFKKIGNTPLRKDALEIVLTGIDSVMPKNIICKNLSFRDDKLIVANNEFDLSKGKLYVIGGGKASGAMAQSLEKIIPPDKIEFGFVNSIKKFKTQKIFVNQASHPIPDERSVFGTKKMLEIIPALTKNDTVICLISGGGSSLLTVPVDEITLREMQDMSKEFLVCGAYAYEHSMVRKYIDKIKGGKLARLLQPAKVISLLLSDELVRENEIASRPTLYEESTFKDAYNIIKKYNLENKISANIIQYIQKGVNGDAEGCVKKDEPFFNNVYNYILGDNKIALNIMKQKAETLGYNTEVLDNALIGDVEYVCQDIQKRINKIKNEKKYALIFSTEVSIPVKAGGLGGRCQEISARLIKTLDSEQKKAFVSIGSDGVDFISGVGGAIIDNTTYKKIKNHLEIDRLLTEHRSYNLHNKNGNLIFMESTGTNVGDLHVYLQENYINHPNNLK